MKNAQNVHRLCCYLFKLQCELTKVIFNECSESVFCDIINKLKLCADRFFPRMTNTCGTNTNKPWMTRKVKNSIKKRQKLYKQYILEKKLKKMIKNTYT